MEKGTAIYRERYVSRNHDMVKCTRIVTQVIIFYVLKNSICMIFVLWRPRRYNTPNFSSWCLWQTTRRSYHFYSVPLWKSKLSWTFLPIFSLWVINIQLNLIFGINVDHQPISMSRYWPHIVFVGYDSRTLLYIASFNIICPKSLIKSYCPRDPWNLTRSGGYPRPK